MTNVIALPLPEQAVEDEDQEQLERERQHAENVLLAEADEAGRRGAGWVRELAARQAERWHQVVLERAADAVERACGPEAVPGGEGVLTEELAYDLAADVVTGSVCAEGLPVLSAGERVALVAVCAVAAAMPAAVGGDGDAEREVPVLVSTMDAAVAAGRTAREI
ncbi:hypothetical protein ACFV6F_16155 [Kitasatospora phosalacinea]|uniref:hypothetical protein n=1 Tax=Kitasatospora phosalacinea TaxID=2065 RepID=UPI00364A8598